MCWIWSSCRLSSSFRTTIRTTTLSFLFHSSIHSTPEVWLPFSRGIVKLLLCSNNNAVDNVDLFRSCAELSLFDEMHVCHDIFGCIIVFSSSVLPGAAALSAFYVAITNRSKLDSERQYGEVWPPDQSQSQKGLFIQWILFCVFRSIFVMNNFRDTGRKPFSFSISSSFSAAMLTVLTVPSNVISN